MRAKEITCLIGIVALITMFCYFFVAAYFPFYNFEEETYVVKNGDSLWCIASEYCPNNMDMHEYISLVKERNGMNSSIIYPGQTIIVLVEQ